jgi:triosephosphate isomerase
VHHEADAIVAAKVKAARRHCLATISCIGETQTQRRDGEVLKVLGVIDVARGRMSTTAREQLRR